ncbi:MAG: hypothetical protein HOP28_12260 [Gemmatimonadales bacterium]|nr:hypothetical protein [Gemmatimonadales bacterium]
MFLLGPLNRVECSAAAAAKKYQPLTIEQAIEIAQGAFFEVVASPVAPIRHSNGKWNVTPPATHVVILDGKGGADAASIQPDSLELTPSEWGNAAGGKFSSVGVRARFSLSKLPPGEFTVVIVTSDGEFRFGIGKKDRPLVQ